LSENKVISIEDQIGIALYPIADLFSDDSVTDIFIYGRDKVFIKKIGSKLTKVNREWKEDIDLIVACNTIAQKMRRKLNRENPILDARLSDGSRVNIVIAPVYSNGACISIRKFPSEKLDSKSFVKLGTLDDNGVKIISSLVKMGKKIVVSGGTGTGKTTLLNILCNYIDESEIVITIEDARELNLSHQLWAALESRKVFFEKEREVSLRDLVINSLRMFPKWIILGEVRGGEVFDLMRAFNSGHSGMTTLHSDSCEDALFALENMFLQGKEMRIDAVRQIISRAVDVVIQIKRFKDESIKVVEIAEITGLKYGEMITKYQLKSLYKFGSDYSENGQGSGFSVCSIPDFLQRDLELSENELPPFWRNNCD